MNTTLKDIQLSKVDRINQEYILKDFLPMPEHTLNIISSSGGMGKSFLALEIACKYIKESKHSVACWFSEDEAPFVKDRYEHLKRHNMVDSIDENKLRLITEEPPQLAKTEKGIFVANYDALSKIRKYCVINDIKMLIIDPLIAFYGGNENDNGQARVFMQPFIQVCKEDYITIILVHHAKKPDQDGEAKTRGATAFIDAVRCAYELHYPISAENRKKYDGRKIKQGIRLVKNTKDNRNVRQFLTQQNGWNGYEKEIKILPDTIDIIFEGGKNV